MQAQQSESVEKMKKALHDLWFSKKEEALMERERHNAMDIKEMSRELELSQKDIERRLGEVQSGADKRIGSIEQSLTILKDVLAELRKENEDLRKDRQFFLDKLSTMIAEKQRQKEEMPETYKQEEEEEIQAAAKTGTYTDHHNEKSVKTSLDQLLELIMEKGSLKMSEASKKLRVKDKQIEEWAHVLEEHGLIEIHYPTVGKPILKKKT